MISQPKGTFLAFFNMISLGFSRTPATDAMVEVVLSLKTTGQHVSVPIRVQTRSMTSAVAGEITADTEDDAYVLRDDGSGFWPSLSWIQLLILVFLTFVLLLACKFK